jgi:predicted nucleotidyltransferase
MVTAAPLAARLAGRLTLDRERLAAFCRRWAVTELALFGSVLRDDFRSDSDVDVLVAFAPGARPGMFDLVDMEEELAGLFGRRVDLVTRRAVEESDNWIRRRAILASAVPLLVVAPQAQSGPGAADAPG